MNTLTPKNIESLRIREYIITDDNDENRDFTKVFRPLENHNINSIPYVELFNTLDKTYLNSLRRYLIKNWNLIAKKIDDTTVSRDCDIMSLCEFFVDDVHRIYFFIETVYFYFFP